jgi:hypothetical protein
MKKMAAATVYRVSSLFYICDLYGLTYVSNLGVANKDSMQHRGGQSATFVADYRYFFPQRKFFTLTDCNSNLFFLWQISLLVNQKRT